MRVLASSFRREVFAVQLMGLFKVIGSLRVVGVGMTRI
jgi:hypothetical protein